MFSTIKYKIPRKAVKDALVSLVLVIQDYIDSLFLGFWTHSSKTDWSIDVLYSTDAFTQSELN